VLGKKERLFDIESIGPKCQLSVAKNPSVDDRLIRSVEVFVVNLNHIVDHPDPYCTSCRHFLYAFSGSSKWPLYLPNKESFCSSTAILFVHLPEYLALPKENGT
jgi:hypothetical protein